MTRPRQQEQAAPEEKGPAVEVLGIAGALALVALAARVPASSGSEGARYAVKYAEETLPEFADRHDCERLMDEIESALGSEPFDPPGHRSEKVEGAPPLRRYRPHRRQRFTRLLRRWSETRSGSWAFIHERPRIDQPTSALERLKRAMAERARKGPGGPA